MTHEALNGSLNVITLDRRSQKLQLFTIILKIPKNAIKSKGVP